MTIRKTYRDKLEALYDLYGIEQTIKSNRKSAQNSPNRKSAEIADSTLPSLLRDAAALRALVETLPERAERAWDTLDGNSIKVMTRTTPLSQEEIDALEIPEFLRRTPA